MLGSLDLVMVFALCLLILFGYPVAFTLAGTALLFALVGYLVGMFDLTFLALFPSRIYGVMTNDVLIAVPLFIFMGVMLERSKIADELLDSMGALFGRLHGGLGISVLLVGALLAASTGIVGATVVTMGLLSLPTMLKRGYDPSLACGSIAAAGTLGQIIPPSIVLVVLGDQISNAHQEAERALGNWAPDPVSVGHLFAGALFPGLVLVGLYVVYLATLAFLRPEHAPPIARSDVGGEVRVSRVAKALVAPLVLILAVLGSILTGVATPTEAASVGAIGAILLAGDRLVPTKPLPLYLTVLSVIGLVLLSAHLDLRVGRHEISDLDRYGMVAAVMMCLIIAYGLFVSLIRAHKRGILSQVMQSTLKIKAKVFIIVIGAQLFSLVFRGFGGDETVHALLSGLPGGAVGAMIVVMALMFVLGFFLDFIEIAFVIVPIIGPVLLQLGLDPVWLGVMIAMNLQTSFLTPPFGFALFYLRGVAPSSITTMQIYRGALPFVLIQLLMLVCLSLFPGLATWLPTWIFG
ncbi:MAG: TRAP transporter large permease subunit [Pseudomonadota bacterium]